MGGAAAIATAGLVVTDRWPDGSPPSDPGGRLILAEQSPGLEAVDVTLEDDARSGRRVAGSSADYRSRSIDSSPFTMLALTWVGLARPVRVQVRSVGGSWSPWRTLPLLHDGPDPGIEGDARVVGTDLTWVGLADGIRVEVPGGRPQDLQLTLMRGDESVDTLGDRTARASTTQRPKPPQRLPTLRYRNNWGADEGWRSGTPTYNSRLEQVHVHHTVNSNDYSRAEVPGLLRGMYRYHTKNLGWSDLGYNFLVDRFGRTWVGRAGGSGKAVRGAHTLGFNDTSTGVAVIGNFEAGRTGGLVVTAIVHFAAWKLHKFGHNPRSRVSVTSTGSDRYGSGRTVSLPRIDGHRDTNETACPGSSLYAKLPEIRRRAAERANKF